MTVHTDSQLVTRQIIGTYQAKELRITAYLQEVHAAMDHFDNVDVQHVPRVENAHADALAHLASATTAGIDDPITIEVLNKPRPPLEILNIHEEDWRKPLIDFITTGHIPDTVKSPHSFRLKASCYTALDGNLYKCGYNIPLLHCVDASTAQEMLEEFHQGTCGTREEPRTLAWRILCYGYYWLDLHQDAKAYVSKCDQCQWFANLST